MAQSDVFSLIPGTSKFVMPSRIKRQNEASSEMGETEWDGGRETSHVERCQRLWRRWKIAPPPPGRGASLWLAISVLLTSGTRGQRAQPSAAATPDVQFMENNTTQTFNLTDGRMVSGWTVVCVWHSHNIVYTFLIITSWINTRLMTFSRTYWCCFFLSPTSVYIHE